MIIDLIEYPDLALVVKAATGVQYTSQTAGFACDHPVAEGFLVPIQTRVGRPELASLQGMFRGSWKSLNGDLADQLDALLRSHELGTVVVDRDALDDSKEAWVHVIVKSAPSDKVPLSEFATDAVRAILTWPNSD